MHVHFINSSLCIINSPNALLYVPCRLRVRSRTGNNIWTISSMALPILPGPDGDGKLLLRLLEDCDSTTTSVVQAINKLDIIFIFPERQKYIYNGVFWAKSVHDKIYLIDLAVCHVFDLVFNRLHLAHVNIFRKFSDVLGVTEMISCLVLTECLRRQILSFRKST